MTLYTYLLSRKSVQIVVVQDKRLEVCNRAKKVFVWEGVELGLRRKFFDAKINKYRYGE